MDFSIATALFQAYPLFFKYLVVFLLGMAPISEARGAIIMGISLGLNPMMVFLLGLIANILVIPILFYFLKVARLNDLALKLFGARTMKKIEKNRKKFEVFGELALILFVAIPLPMTGAWTGVLIAHILKFNKRRSFAVISAGVLIASLIVLTSTLGVSFVL